jgi:hypothetical protein
MRFIFTLCAVFSLAVGLLGSATANLTPGAVQTIAPIPGDATALYTKLWNRLSAGNRAKMRTLAIQFEAALKMPGADPQRTVATVVTSGFPGESSMDIQALVLIVLMEATNDQDNDLQQIMNEMQQQAAAKQFLRNQLEAISNAVAPNSAVSNAQSTPTPKATLSPLQQSLQGKLDNLNDVSQMSQLALQQEMSERAQFMQIISNIMKAIQSTQNSILQNLKS